jgi:hypothetical protein
MNKHKTYPYVTVLEHNGVTYYGIIKIKSKQYCTLYCFHLMNEDQQEELLEQAYIWWCQSNRTIPMCLFMREEIEQYEVFTQRFNTDSVKFISGPVISLSDLPTKRIKRRNVALKKRK